MDIRALATLAARVSGLWLIVMYVPTMVWMLVRAARAMTSGDPLPEGYGWDVAEYGGSILLFIAGVYLFLDGRDVIDQFQFSPPKHMRAAGDPAAPPPGDIQP